jgi:RNA polymerase sigma-70 factor (ECF subfamily)
MTSDEDARIVETCLAGDARAYRVLMDRYERPLFNAAYRVVNDYEDAMDATQAAFVKAYENLHTFDTSRRFFSWIYRILLNESLNIAKRRKRFDELNDNLAVRARSAEEHLHEKEKGRSVQSALMGLKTEHRVVLVLKHYQGMSYREMSEVVGVPEKTIKSRLFSARQRLKDILLKKGLVR